MRAYRIPSPGAPAEWQEVPVPRPAPDQVLLRMKAAGVCRTDLEIMDHGIQFVPWVGSYTLGHENIGEVVGLGEAVTGRSIGDMVVVNAGGTCGVCRNCLTGDDNFCTARPLVYGTANDGGLADFMVARQRDVLSIGSLAPTTAAPLGDAGATAYGAVQRALPGVGDNGAVVVIGVGGLGSFALQLLRLKTTATVIAVDLPERLAHAKERGAHATVASDAGAAAAILALTDGTGVDAVLDFVGIDATLTLSAQITRSLGSVTLVGTGGGTLPFGFMASQAGVRFSTHASCSLEELTELISITERGLLDVDTTFYPFAELERAYDDLRAGRIVGRGVLTF